MYIIIRVSRSEMYEHLYLNPICTGTCYIYDPWCKTYHVIPDISRFYTLSRQQFEIQKLTRLRVIFGNNFYNLKWNVLPDMNISITFLPLQNNYLLPSQFICQIGILIIKRYKKLTKLSLISGNIWYNLTWQVLLDINICNNFLSVQNKYPATYFICQKFGEKKKRRYNDNQKIQVVDKRGIWHLYVYNISLCAKEYTATHFICQNVEKKRFYDNQKVQVLTRLRVISKNISYNLTGQVLLHV